MIDLLIVAGGERAGIEQGTHGNYVDAVEVAEAVFFPVDSNMGRALMKEKNEAPIEGRVIRVPVRGEMKVSMGEHPETSSPEDYEDTLHISQEITFCVDAFEVVDGDIILHPVMDPSEYPSLVLRPE